MTLDLLPVDKSSVQNFGPHQRKFSLHSSTPQCLQQE